MVMDPNLSLSLDLDKTSASWLTATTKPVANNITIKYRIENTSEKEYQTSDYFYKIVLGRAVDAPGFVISEFSKHLSSKETYEATLTWTPQLYETVDREKKGFKVYLYAYKNIPFKDALLVGYTAVPFEFDGNTNVKK